MNNIIETLNRRYATKQFDTDQTLSDEQIYILTESMRLAPSSFGLQPWKFIVISDPKLKAQLKAHSYGQDKVTQASHLIVLCAADDTTESDVQCYIDSIVHATHVDLSQLEWYQNAMNMSLESMSQESRKHRAENQVYIALWFLLMAAAEIEVDACPMEWFDRQAYDKLLHLKWTGYHSTVIAALGFRSSDDTTATVVKVRYDVDEVIKYIN